MMYVRTKAYNAGKTLHRAVDSVLNQTRDDFVYYLIDNGSTDNTGNIVSHYAALDSRIRPFYNAKNNDYTGNTEAKDVCHNLQDEDHYCILDADDELYPTFLEDMLRFMEERDLDIACCGNDFVHIASRSQSQRLLHTEWIFTPADMGRNLHILLPFLRTVWGKIFRGSACRAMATDNAQFPEYIEYGSDTANVLWAFEVSHRIGILPKSLYRYYVSGGSVSYRYTPQRVKDNQALINYLERYLRNHGSLSLANRDILLFVYEGALRETLPLLLGAKLPSREKLANLLDMVLHERTLALASQENLDTMQAYNEAYRSQRYAFFEAVNDWMCARKEVADAQVEAFCQAGQIASAVCGNSSTWVFYEKLRIQYLIQQGRHEEANARIQELAMLVPGDAHAIK